MKEIQIVHRSGHADTLGMPGGSDGGNPQSLAVQGTSSVDVPAIPTPVIAPPESGGGCSVGPPGRRGGDTSLAWLALAAAALAWLRRPRKR